jgi:opacity protein-like surface antigen
MATRGNDVDSHEAGGQELPGSDGEVMSAAYMFNALRDLPGLIDHDYLTPFVGAGIGAGAAEFQGYSVEGVPEVLDDEDAGFAYQLIAGVSYGVTERVDITLDYRYFSILDLEVDTTLGDNNSDIDFDSHNVFAGVRYTFR